MSRQFVAAAAAVSCTVAALFAGQTTYNPKVYGPSDEGLKAIKRLQIPKGTEATLYAAEPMVANIVCFCFDERGNLYVAETFRHHAGVTDNRDQSKRKTWLDEDLALRSVDDRLAMLKRQLGNQFDSYTKEHERVRKLIDTKGDGVPDKAFVFADDFHVATAGIGAGLLARDGKVWYACIPDLWLLQDTKGTNQADSVKSLHYGYGVHTSFLGHDLHGLRMGPDGRIYFSIGDRALNVQTGGRSVVNLDSGAVLRCNPDGSELEIVATGLRNPQELTFDQYGNLFTGDNNADGGDKARWVYVVEGGDSGWRIGYQYMTKPTRLGPWNAEKMWYTQFDGQSAHLVPPVNYIGNGPSGVTYNPGVTQLPERYNDHFFMCDFKGSAGQSGIHTFQLKPRGAYFDFKEKPEHFVWSSLVTDCDFGPDGGFYWSDWVKNWETSGKGRIYRLADPTKAKDPAVLEVKKLLAEGMSKRSVKELVQLLAHADMRVRMEAQFELAHRNAVPELTTAAEKGVMGQGAGTRLSRLHSIWGLGMVHRATPKNAAVLAGLLPLLADKDVEVRCQALKELSDAHYAAMLPATLNDLKADEPRVRFFAALALGKLGNAQALPAVVSMLRDNADKDPYLRHAGVMAVVGIGNREFITNMGKDPSPAVRMASLVAMRRLGMPEVTRFIADADPKLVLEAARAINDQPIDQGLPQLAALIGRAGLSDPVMYRAINSNFRLKQKANAAALAKFAGRGDVSETLRVEALDCLRTWDQEGLRDRIVGLHRPVAAALADEVVVALKSNLGAIFSGPNKVRTEGAKLAAKFGIKEVGPALLEAASDTKRPASVRVASLSALATLKDSELSNAMNMALKDNDPHVRTAGRRIMAQLQPDAVVAALRKALADGDFIDRQGAFAILGELKQPGVDELIGTWLDKLLAKNVPAEVQLDLLEAAGKRKSATIDNKVAQYEAKRAPNDHLAKWSESLQGGDAENGRRIFFDRSDVSCLRCHKIQGNGGEVGPDLTGIGSKQKREYLLESIVEPDKQIAKGYETVVLTLTDGKVKSGILKSEDKNEVRLMTPEGTTMVIPVAEIDSRSRGPSAMPADVVRFLSRRDLRDLVEFLSNLK